MTVFAAESEGHKGAQEQKKLSNNLLSLDTLFQQFTLRERQIYRTALGKQKAGAFGILSIPSELVVPLLSRVRKPELEMLLGKLASRTVSEPVDYRKDVDLITTQVIRFIASRAERQNLYHFMHHPSSYSSVLLAVDVRVTLGVLDEYQKRANSDMPVNLVPVYTDALTNVRNLPHPKLGVPQGVIQ